MARTIVNKHLDNKEIVTRKQFHENEEYAKGEIIIVNDENPSIYVLDNAQIPRQIVGGGSSGGSVSPEVIEEIKAEITNEYTVADNTLRQEMLKADAELADAISNVNSDFRTEFNKQIKTVEDAYKVADFNIKQQITETKAEVLSHTINGIAISGNPVLDASNIGVGRYTELILDSTLAENVITNDAIQIALKKIENMAIANALAFSAALNDINGRLEEALKRIDELEGNTSEE